MGAEASWRALRVDYGGNLHWEIWELRLCRSGRRFEATTLLPHAKEGAAVCQKRDTGSNCRAATRSLVYNRGQYDSSERVHYPNRMRHRSWRKCRRVW